MKEARDRATIACRLQAGAPGTSMLDAAARRCGDALHEGTCGSLPASCALVGTLAAGQVCAYDAQCSSGWCVTGATIPGKPAYCGTCVAKAGAGGACSLTSDCNRGFTCVMGACRAPAKLGDSCEHRQDPIQSDCLEPNHCDALGTCAAPVQRGGECGAHDCASGLICGRCDPVGSPSQCGDLDCPSGQVCADSATSYRCAAPKFANPGESCNTTVGVFCARRGELTGGCFSYRNIYGVCNTIVSDGEACDPLPWTTPWTKRECDRYAGCWDGICQIPDYRKCVDTSD